MKTTPRAWLAAFWRAVRSVTGDDAYERYAAHERAHHPEREPMDRRTFYVTEQHRRFSGGPTRCC
jgi:uncharacterized short protein YbdD (DUF466 family)